MIPHHTGLDTRKYDFVGCKQQRHRPAAQSGQHLCYLFMESTVIVFNDLARLCN